jgi:hypothetical protein
VVLPRAKALPSLIIFALAARTFHEVVTTLAKKDFIKRRLAATLPINISTHRMAGWSFQQRERLVISSSLLPSGDTWPIYFNGSIGKLTSNEQRGHISRGPGLGVPYQIVEIRHPYRSL